MIAFALGGNEPEISERFLLHRLVERYKDALIYQQCCEALGYELFSDDQMAEFQRLHDEVVARFGGPFKTLGMAAPLFPANPPATLAKLAQLVGLDHFKPWFRLSSRGVRSGATGAAIHIRDFYGRGHVMLADPSNANLADMWVRRGTWSEYYRAALGLVVRLCDQMVEVDSD